MCAQLRTLCVSVDATIPVWPALPSVRLFAVQHRNGMFVGCGALPKVVAISISASVVSDDAKFSADIAAPAAVFVALCDVKVQVKIPTTGDHETNLQMLFRWLSTQLRCSPTIHSLYFDMKTALSPNDLQQIDVAAFDNIWRYVSAAFVLFSCLSLHRL